MTQLPPEVFDALINRWRHQLGLEAQRLWMLSIRLEGIGHRLEWRRRDAMPAHERLRLWEEERAERKRQAAERKRQAAKWRYAAKAHLRSAPIKAGIGSGANFDWESCLHAHDYRAPDYYPQTSDLTGWWDEFDLTSEAARDYAYEAVRDRVSHFHAGAE